MSWWPETFSTYILSYRCIVLYCIVLWPNQRDTPALSQLHNLAKTYVLPEVLACHKDRWARMHDQTLLTSMSLSHSVSAQYNFVSTVWLMYTPILLERAFQRLAELYNNYWNIERGRECQWLRAGNCHDVSPHLVGNLSYALHPYAKPVFAPWCSVPHFSIMHLAMCFESSRALSSE